jgi:hypothetical protein
MRGAVGAFGLGTFVFVSAGTARGEPVTVTFALTVNGLTGDHETGGETDHYALLPLPLAELSLRSGADTLRVEGMPPLTFGYTGGSRLFSTRLSIVNATVRHAFAGGWFAGAGETIYNQGTQYAQPSDEVQSSRVAGLRVELGRTFGPAANRIEAFGAVNGRMHGVQYTTVSPVLCRIAGAQLTCTPTPFTHADPESAAQVDLTARLAHRLSSRTELLAGVRYLNYTARYDAAPAVLADRNVGFAPSLGVRARL